MTRLAPTPRRSRTSTPWLAFGLLAVAACGAEAGDALAPTEGDIAADDEVVETTVGGDQLRVDLRDPDRVYRFDPSAAELDFAHVLLICPDGRSMPMDDWLEEQAPIIGTDFFFAPGGFTLAARAQDEPPAEDPTCTCERKCRRCPDGAWVCFDECVGDCNHATGVASAIANRGSVRDRNAWEQYPHEVPTSPYPRGDGGRPWDGQDGAPPSDPTPPSTPSDPPDGSGGGGGSGGGWGGSGGSGSGGSGSGGGSGGWGQGGGRGGGGRPGGGL
jgi:hypothetical protein